MRVFFKLLIPYWDKLFFSLLVRNSLLATLLLPPLILKALIDHAYPYQDFRLVLLLLSIPFILAVIFNTINALQSYLDLLVSQQLYNSLFLATFSHIQRLPIYTFYNFRKGDLIYRLSQDIQTIESTLIGTVTLIISESFKLILLLILCFSLHPAVTLLALAGIPFSFMETRFFSAKLKALSGQNHAINSALFTLVEERLSTQKLIKLLNRIKQEVDLVKDKLFDLFNLERHTRLIQSLHGISSTVVNRGWSLGLGILVGYYVVSRTLTIGEGIAIITYVSMLQTPVTTLFDQYTKLATSRISFDKISSLLDLPVEKATSDDKAFDPIDIGEIVFNNVSFGYTANDPVLRNVSFTLPKGGSLAIVGKSGIGKSSIGDLILGFYETDFGTISFNGHSIDHFSVNQIRWHVGFVPHHAHLFDGTIRDNIAIGLHADPQFVSEDAIIDASKKAFCHAFITALPDGYNTHIGQNGYALSAGQRQRIAIARALIRQPQCLIFDEAMSALDGEAEKHLQQTLDALKGEITVIIMAHRLSTIRPVDQVLVLGDDGSIVETGSPKELLGHKGVFYKLYELQVGGMDQFINLYNHFSKSVQRYKRPLGLGLMKLKEFDRLQSELSTDELHKVMYDLEFSINVFIRDADIAFYQHNGYFWLLFPETDLSGIDTALNRVSTHAAAYSCETYSGSITLDFVGIQVTGHELFEDVADQLHASLLEPTA